MALETKPIRIDRKQYLTPRHGALNVARLLAMHGLLAGWFAWGYSLPLAPYLIGAVLISLIHQRELSEWIHEASHFNFVENREWNDRLITLLAGLIMATEIKSYRQAHFKHHSSGSFFNAEDPDTALFTLKTRGDFWRALLADLTGVSLVGAYFKILFRKKSPGADQGPSKLPFYGALAVFQAGIIALLALAGRIDVYLIYYGTLLTLYSLLLSRLRLYGQHAHLGPSGALLAGSTASRTVDAGLADRIFFTSRVMMYHYEHHQFSSLPYRALHAISRESDDINRYSKSRWTIVKALYRGLA